MELIEIDNKKYITADKLFEYAPLFCKGARNTRELIKKKNIKSEDFIYGRENKNGEWIISDGKSKRLDKILLNQSLILTIPECREYNKEDNKEEKENKEQKEINENKKYEKYNIEKVPPLIVLEDEEKFKDENGNILEIETRGNRKVDKIFFSVEDVSKRFELENLYKLLKDERKTYKINEHYKIFICKNSANADLSSVETTNKIQKKLYLTYEGMLKVLFSSRSPKVKKFVKWATETLFTLQMGSVEEKQEIISNTLGIDPRVIKEVLNGSANTLPCIYLITLGDVKSLKTKLNIDTPLDDTDIICKFGFTYDLQRRLKEHNLNYSNKGVNIRLKYYSYVDPQFLSEAETSIKSFFELLDRKVTYNKQTEIVSIPIQLYEKKIMKEQYELISKKYSGHYNDLIEQIKILKNESEKKDLQHQLDMERLKNEVILQKKDIELLEYKIKFLELEKMKS